MTHPTADTLPGFDAFVATPLGKMLLATLDAAMPPGGPADERQQAAYEALAAYEPRDSLEHMLAAQAVAAHFAAMECFRHAMQPDTDPRLADRVRGQAAALGRTMRDAMKMIAQHRRQTEAAPKPEPGQIKVLEPIPFEPLREVVPPDDPKSHTMQPADFRIKVLNGDPVRDWMSRRYAPGDDMEGAYAEAVRQSAAMDEADAPTKAEAGASEKVVQDNPMQSTGEARAKLF